MQQSCLPDGVHGGRRSSSSPVILFITACWRGEQTHTYTEYSVGKHRHRQSVGQMSRRTHFYVLLSSLLSSFHSLFS